MIILRTQTYPGFRSGFMMIGKVNTNSSGVGTITITGKDISSKITGIQLCPVGTAASQVKCVNAWVVSIGFSQPTTTITIQANTATDSGTGTTDIAAYDGDVYYILWLDDATLPTDLTVNDITKPR